MGRKRFSIDLMFTQKCRRKKEKLSKENIFERIEFAAMKRNGRSLVTAKMVERLFPRFLSTCVEPIAPWKRTCAPGFPEEKEGEGERPEARIPCRSPMTTRIGGF